jgi:hypothetical protein
MTRAGFATASGLIRSVLLGLVAGGVLLGCGGGDHADTSIEWTVFNQVGPRTVKLVAEVDYCMGAPVPKIARAETAYSGHRVLIGLFLAAPPQSYQTDKCRGVVRPVYKSIKLKRHPTALQLFDTSTSPPTQRWPN